MNNSAIKRSKTIRYHFTIIFLSILSCTIWRLYTFRQNPIVFAKLNLLAKSDVLPNCINRHVISGIKKAQKERLTSRSGEPLQA